MDAFRAMVDHASMLREFFAHLADLPPATAGREECEGLFTHLKKKKMITGKFLARHFLAMQQAIAIQVLGNVYWIPGRENPADG